MLTLSASVGGQHHTTYYVYTYAYIVGICLSNTHIRIYIRINSVELVCAKGELGGIAVYRNELRIRNAAATASDFETIFNDARCAQQTTRGVVVVRC